MAQIIISNMTDDKAKHCRFHISISLVLSTLLIFTSCSSTSSTHLNPATTTPGIAATIPVGDTVIANPYPPYQGTLVLNDPLHDNSHSYNWDESTSSCQFSHNA